jgi:ketosteroid isomerase-like protein
MSEENVETVRRAFEAFASDGPDALIPFCSLDLIVHPFPEWMEAPAYHGHDGLRELLKGWTEGFEDFAPQVNELREAGDDVVVWLGHNTGRIRGTKIPINQQVGGVHRLRDGLLVEVHYFMTWEEALEAAGLSE